MPIYRLKPVPAMTEDPAWRNTPYHGPCWVHAADETEARGLVSGRYEDARVNVPGRSEGASPWMDPRLVTAELFDAPPEGMSIPNGVVVADRQL